MRGVTCYTLRVVSASHSDLAFNFKAAKPMLKIFALWTRLAEPLIQLNSVRELVLKVNIEEGKF